MQANKSAKRNLVSYLLSFALLLSLPFASARALTPAGTVIENIATVEYDGGSSDSNIARLTVTQLYGITLTPDGTALSGLPGQTLYFPLTLTNTGNFADNFQLGASSQQGWGVQLLRDTNRDGVHQDSEQTAISATGSLAQDGQYFYFAALSIPVGAAAGLQDTLTLSARCSVNSTWRTEVSYTAVTQPQAGVTLQPSQALLTALPSEELYLNFLLTNSGNLPNTYTLSANSPQGWPVELIADTNQDGIHQSTEIAQLDPSVSLAAGAQLHGFLRIQTPADFSSGSGTLRLQAVSSLDAKISAQGEYTIAFPEIPLGDITGDGTIGVDDANAIAEIALGTGDWTGDQIARADVNGDGAVNVLDITFLLSLANSSKSSLPGDSARRITLPTTTALPGADKALGLAIDQGAGVVGFQATILLDNDILGFSQLLPGNLIANPEAWEILSSIDEAGALTVLAYATNGASLTAGTGNILSLQGIIAPDAQIGESVVLAWAEPIVSNAQGTPFTPLTAMDGMVTISEAVGSLQGQATTLLRRRSVAVSGALVELLEGGQLLTSTLSDAAGNWQLAALPMGSYQVRISAVGYYTEIIDNVTVNDGEVTPVNFSLTAVKKSKTGGLKGLVVSQTGSPIKKAKLHFYRDGRKVASASTGSSGQYLKVPLAPACYTMVVTAKGGVPVESQVEILDNHILQADFVL